MTYNPENQVPNITCPDDAKRWLYEIGIIRPLTNDEYERLWPEPTGPRAQVVYSRPEVFVWSQDAEIDWHYPVDRGDPLYRMEYGNPPLNPDTPCSDCGGPGVTWEDGFVMCDDCVRLMITRMKLWFNRNEEE